MKYLSLKHWMLILLPFTVATSVLAADDTGTGGTGSGPADSKGWFASASDSVSEVFEDFRNHKLRSALLALAVGTSVYYLYEKFAKDEDQEEEDGVTA